MPEDDLIQNSDTTETLDSQNNEDSAQDDDDRTGVAVYEYDDDGNAIEITPEDAEPVENDPTQVEASASPAFRPSFQPRNVAEAEQYLAENVDSNVLNSIMAVMDARYANARSGETISDHYVNQIEQAAPGFITAQERTFIRNLPPQQQADPGSVVMATFSSAIRKASETGLPAEAITEFCEKWLKKAGKPIQRAPAPVLPPSQRVGASGGGGGTVTRPAASSGRGLPANKGGSTNFLRDYVGLTDREAQKLTREL